MEPDVLVVGAGPVGAAVSILLARQGYRVLLVECATCPRDKACAEYLSPAYTPLLAQLGILDAILTAAPQRLQGMRVMDHWGRSCWGRFIQDGRCLYGACQAGDCGGCGAVDAGMIARSGPAHPLATTRGFRNPLY